MQDLDFKRGDFLGAVVGTYPCWERVQSSSCHNRIIARMPHTAFLIHGLHARWS